jgi:hypothetical protein
MSCYVCDRMGLRASPRPPFHGTVPLEAAGVVASLVQSLARTDRPPPRCKKTTSRRVELAGTVVVAWPRQ